MFLREGAENANTESLGKRVFEGVEAQGTKTTYTTPAGEIGNERPIVTESERWYSDELKATMMTRYSDPRHGSGGSARPPRWSRRVRSKRRTTMR